jgi:hypothetical protein
MPSKWVRDLQQKHHKEHMERIRKMQPVVDNKKPRELPMSGKKEIERRRFREKVEKGNRLLLDRLGKALERKNIDNERKPIKFNSLEQGKKKAELARVTMENQLLLHRIQQANPMYDHHQWERDAEHREFYLRNMTEFPELYCPHYPPLRKKFLKEKAEKEQQRRYNSAEKKARKRAEEKGIPFSPSMIKMASISGQMSPPSHEPSNSGMGRPSPGKEGGINSPTLADLGGRAKSFRVDTGAHQLEMRTKELEGETYYQAKGEALLHEHKGAHATNSHDLAFFADGHHMTSAEKVHHGLHDAPAFVMYHNKDVASLENIPGPYVGSDTHGHGHAGIVGNVGDFITPEGVDLNKEVVEKNAMPAFMEKF